MLAVLFIEDACSQLNLVISEYFNYQLKIYNSIVQMIDLFEIMMPKTVRMFHKCYESVI